jgi:hypothetical protein
VRHTINHAVAVVGQQPGAVLGERESGGSTEVPLPVYQKPRHEILKLLRPAVREHDARHDVA